MVAAPQEWLPSPLRYLNTAFEAITFWRTRGLSVVSFSTCEVPYHYAESHWIHLSWTVLSFCLSRIRDAKSDHLTTKNPQVIPYKSTISIPPKICLTKGNTTSCPPSKRIVLFIARLTAFLTPLMAACP